MSYKISVDTGGTFTDVVVADQQGHLTVGKAVTTPDRIFLGMREALEASASELHIALLALLRQTNILIYGTTQATNAIVTGHVAKTAFFTTKGFPDILVMKEGGRYNAHDPTSPRWAAFLPLVTLVAWHGVIGALARAL